MQILHETSDFIIVNKPADLLSIPDRFLTGKPNVLQQLQAKYGDTIFVCHRIDRETSGIMVFARNEAAHRSINMQFENRTTEKIYYAIVEGVLHETEGEINKPIGTHPTIPNKQIIAKTGKPSLTLFKLIEQFKGYALVEADIKTGRMHQIRVHFQSIGYPLAVDSIYGRKTNFCLSEIKHKKFKLGKYVEDERPLMSRTTLHAFRLVFDDPTTGERLRFEADPPKDFLAMLQQLRKWNVVKGQ